MLSSQSVNNQGRPRAARAAKYRHNMQQTNSTVTGDQVRVQYCCNEESKRKIISQDRVSVAKTLKVRCSQKQSAHLHIISSKKEKPYLQKKKSGWKYSNPICGRYNLYYNIYDIYRFLPINWSCLHLKKTFPPGFLFSSHETFWISFLRKKNSRILFSFTSYILHNYTHSASVFSQPCQPMFYFFSETLVKEVLNLFSASRSMYHQDVPHWTDLL